MRRGIRFLFLEFAAFDPPASLREALRAGQEKMLLHIFRAESGAI
jgi:hypothetical protein